jgi:hypothetical protein
MKPNLARAACLSAVFALASITPAHALPGC